LPAPLGGSELVAWRIDKAIYAWDSGEGAYRAGARWNSRGIRAAAKGFMALDTVPHVLTSSKIADRSGVHIVNSVPNWLIPGTPSAGQQKFGDSLLMRYKFVVIPSTVVAQSWNLLFVATTAAGAYAVRSQEPFALDTRLNPPAP